jgi:hypothetical protein
VGLKRPVCPLIIVNYALVGDCLMGEVSGLGEKVAVWTLLDVGLLSLRQWQMCWPRVALPVWTSSCMQRTEPS